MFGSVFNGFAVESSNFSYNENLGWSSRQFFGSKCSVEQNFNFLFDFFKKSKNWWFKIFWLKLQICDNIFSVISQTGHSFRVCLFFFSLFYKNFVCTVWLQPHLFPIFLKFEQLFSQNSTQLLRLLFFILNWKAYVRGDYLMRKSPTFQSQTTLTCIDISVPDNFVL